MSLTVEPVEAPSLIDEVVQLLQPAADRARIALAVEGGPAGLRLRFTDGGAAAADVVVGADGVGSALRAQLIQAELRTEAVRAGIVDLDGVKLVDATGLALNAAGELEGGAALMAALRASKPWLFGRSSSSAASRPSAYES